MVAPYFGIFDTEGNKMLRTINLAGRDVELNTSMGWLYVYRNQFGRDILPDVMPILEAVISGLGEMSAALIEDGAGNKKIDAEAARQLMDSDAIVDMFVKLSGMELTTIFNMFWAMAKNKDASIPGPIEYMNTFDRLPVDELAPAMLYMILDSSVSEKNAKRLLPSVAKVIPSVLTPSPSPEQTEG